MDAKQASAIASAYLDRVAAGELTPSEYAASRVILGEFIRELVTVPPPVLGTTAAGELTTIVRDTDGRPVAMIKEPMTVARVHE